MPQIKKQVFHLSLILLASIFFTGCENEPTAINDISWKEINETRNEPAGMKRFEFDGISFLVPEAATPASSDAKDESNWNVLSRGFSLKIKKHNHKVTDSHFAEIFRKEIGKYASVLKDHSPFIQDSALINGSYSRYIDADITKFGFPKKLACRLVFIQSENAYYELEYLSLIEDRKLIERLIVGLRIN